MPSNWNLEDGLKLVRALQMDTRKYGYHLALGGGVLNNGESKKDIDLYFLPLDNNRMNKPNPTALIDWLVKLWGNFEVIGANYGQDNLDIRTIGEQPTLSLDIETTPAPSNPTPFPTRNWAELAVEASLSNPSLSQLIPPSPDETVGYRANTTSYRRYSGRIPSSPPPPQQQQGYTWDSMERATDSFWQATPVQVELPTPKPGAAYKYKLKFTRASGDRIDTFIL